MNESLYITRDDYYHASFVSTTDVADTLGFTEKNKEWTD